MPLCLNELTSLRSLSLRDNHVSNTQISARLFDNQDLSILDLSHNKLAAFPKDIENAKGLIVLNLSSNQYVFQKNDPIKNSKFNFLESNKYQIMSLFHYLN